MLGTTIAVVTWVAITHSYRNEKRILTTEIGNRLQASDITDTSNTVQPTEEMRSVAREIAKWCLWRWDGFLGFRAGSDSVGRRAGVWKDKFDSVRCAVLLAAMASLNRTLCDNVTLSSRSDDSGEHSVLSRSCSWRLHMLYSCSGQHLKVLAAAEKLLCIHYHTTPSITTNKFEQFKLQCILKQLEDAD